MATAAGAAKPAEGLASVQDRGDAQEMLLLNEDTLDRSMHYRWVRNDPSSITKRQTQGYRMVSRSDDKVRMTLELSQPVDDYLHNADTVLMCCERNRFEDRGRRSGQLSESRLGAPTAAFRQRHAQSGAVNSKVLVDEEGEGR